MPQARILVVEDEDVIRMLIVETLEDAGYLVDAVNTADAAIHLVDIDGYRLMVTDVHTPGHLTGIDLARHAQTHNPPLPVILVTGRPETVVQLRGLGIKGAVLPKPVPLADLVRAVATHAM